MHIRKIEIERPRAADLEGPSPRFGFVLFAMAATLVFVAILACDALGIHAAPEDAAALMQPE